MGGALLQLLGRSQKDPQFCMCTVQLGLKGEACVSPGQRSVSGPVASDSLIPHKKAF